MKQSTALVSKMCKKLACKVYFATGHPLPFGMRRFYLREVNRRAVKNYVPETYFGNVLLFRAVQSWTLEVQSAWSKVIHGKLEIHDVPGDHLSFLNEPNVQILAKVLGDCLETGIRLITN
jgi:hypothetical protein